MYEGAGKMMRVAGSIESVHDINLREKLIEDRPVLLEIGIPGATNPTIAIFRIQPRDAYFQAMKYNLWKAEAPGISFR